MMTEEEEVKHFFSHVVLYMAHNPSSVPHAVKIVGEALKLSKEHIHELRKM